MQPPAYQRPMQAQAQHRPDDMYTPPSIWHAINVAFQTEVPRQNDQPSRCRHPAAANWTPSSRSCASSMAPASSSDRINPMASPAGPTAAAAKTDSCPCGDGGPGCGCGGSVRTRLWRAELRLQWRLQPRSVLHRPRRRRVVPHVRIRWPKWQEVMVFGGVQGFTSPYDQNRDSGNFGFNEGFNIGAKVPYAALGYQFGYRATQRRAQRRRQHRRHARLSAGIRHGRLVPPSMRRPELRRRLGHR